MSDTPAIAGFRVVSQDVWEAGLAACEEYRSKLDKLERENAALRNEIVRLNNQTMWVCSCGGTDCAGHKENAALRAELEAAKAFHRVAVAERDAARKEAKP